MRWIDSISGRRFWFHGASPCTISHLHRCWNFRCISPFKSWVNLHNHIALNFLYQSIPLLYPKLPLLCPSAESIIASSFVRRHLEQDDLGCASRWIHHQEFYQNQWASRPHDNCNHPYNPISNWNMISEPSNPPNSHPMRWVGRSLGLELIIPSVLF